MSNATQPTAQSDEPSKEISVLHKAFIRPEVRGIVGTIAVFTFLRFALDSGMFNSQAS